MDLIIVILQYACPSFWFGFLCIRGERGMGRTSFARHLAPAVADKFGLRSRQIYVNLRGEELDRDEEERTLYRKV